MHRDGLERQGICPSLGQAHASRDIYQGPQQKLLRASPGVASPLVNMTRSKDAEMMLFRDD